MNPASRLSAMTGCGGRNSLGHPRRVRRLLFREVGADGVFQSTHPRRVRRTRSDHAKSRCCCFNPRTRVGATITAGFLHFFVEFQSTHPRRVRQRKRRNHACERTVSIHAPTQGATSAQAAEWVGLGRFNPRTHAGCDPRRAPVRSAGHAVSIHAPTQGATPTVDLAHGHIPVSIHAPTQGATIGPSRIGAMVGFQSTHPRRVRLCAHAIPTLMSGFNPRTHAGCDACAAAAAAPTPRFNPRTHAGCDQTDCVVRATPSMFQSTHPRRVRPQRCIIPADAVFPCFNPRTHAGCDDTAAPRWPCRPPFQSTHPRRVRRRAADRAIDRAGVSIHAPTQGATMGTVRLAAVGVVSIHAPTQGATRRRRLVRPHPARFNPRTHAGCDPGIARLAESVEDVSIHAPTQGATSPASPDRWFRWRFNPRTHAGCDRPTR